jgi:fatty-acyl-CoA synthase
MNDAARVRRNSIGDAVHRAATHFGDRAALEYDGRSWSFRDIDAAAGRIATCRDVEEALFTHPAESEVAVIALPDPKWNEAITAVMALRPGHAADEAALMAHARALLAPSKLPKHIIFAEDLPRNSAGKLLKRELRRIHGADTPWS